MEVCTKLNADSLDLESSRSFVDWNSSRSSFSRANGAERVRLTNREQTRRTQTTKHERLIIYTSLSLSLSAYTHTQCLYVPALSQISPERWAGQKLLLPSLTTPHHKKKRGVGG
uniref:Uncharacterized protein n=1 Tax=Daphnia magna TaxID=35525 RepID=A0A0P5D893_9CRUS